MIDIKFFDKFYVHEIIGFLLIYDLTLNKKNTLTHRKVITQLTEFGSYLIDCTIF